MSGRAGSTVIEVAGSHSIYVSQPAAVAAFIKTAVNATIPAAVGTRSVTEVEKHTSA